MTPDKWDERARLLLSACADLSQRDEARLRMAICSALRAARDEGVEKIAHEGRVIAIYVPLCPDPPKAAKDVETQAFLYCLDDGTPVGVKVFGDFGPATEKP